MFGLQFGDEITALQKLPEFLWRVESNYTSGWGCPTTGPLRKQSAIRHPAARVGLAKSPIKASFFIFLLFNQTVSINRRGHIFGPCKAEVFWGELSFGTLFVLCYSLINK